MDRPDVTVIVCTYNRAELLRGALLDLVRQEMDGLGSFEVLVIDDGSTDETGRVVHEVKAASSTEVRYVHQDGRGLTEAMNLGVLEARGKWVAFFDDDQRAQSHWLKELFVVARNRGAMCVAGNRVLTFLDGADPCLGPLARGILGEQLYSGDPGALKSRNIRKNIPAGGTFLMARDLFETVGPFSAPLRMYGLDTGGTDSEYMVRIRRAGHDLWASPASVTCHLIPPYRLGYSYLRWVSLRQGSMFVQMDWMYRGCAKTTGLGIARLGQVCLITLPRLLMAFLKSDMAAKVDRRVELWRTFAYMRHFLSIVLPGLFNPERFFVLLEFRAERDSFGGAEGEKIGGGQ